MKKTFMTERQMNKNILLKDGDYESIRQVLERIASILPDNRILAELDQDKNIVYYTGKDIYEEVMNLGDGLIDAGLKDTHIAIIAENSVRYVLSDICISSGVGVVTPIDREAPIDLLVTLLDKCDADAVICNAKIVRTLEDVMDKCPRVKTLITIDKQKEGYLSYDELVKRGAALKDKSIYRNIKLDLEAPAKILFTSGTTGANKGVVLTNANLAANILNCMDTIMATPENTAMSVLPMHHATEINTHIMTRVASGRLTYINDNMRNMMANMKLFKPNCITIVPMIANAFYKGIWTNAAKLGKAEKLKKGIKVSNLLRKFGKDKTHSMFADLFAPFGGNLEFIVCGGSMLNPEVVKGMNDLGVRMENGYGITECGPLISMNSETLKEHLSVGKPCPGLEAKLINVNEEGVGELCIRGKSVAKGYYKDEEATRKVFMEDGFFNTGDSARIDAEGKIFLVGRKKNTIVLENGKNICPEEVENVIESTLSYADEVVVYHPDYDGRPVLCVGLYISDDARRADRDGILSDVKKANGLLPSYKRVDYIEIVDRPYEKTSTRKIKRGLLPETCSGSGIKVF